MKRRLFTIITCLVLGSVCAAGCGSQEEVTKEQLEEADESASEDDKPEDGFAWTAGQCPAGSGREVG